MSFIAILFPEPFSIKKQFDKYVSTTFSGNYFQFLFDVYKYFYDYAPLITSSGMRIPCPT